MASVGSVMASLEYRGLFGASHSQLALQPPAGWSPPTTTNLTSAVRNRRRISRRFLVGIQLADLFERFDKTLDVLYALRRCQSQHPTDQGQVDPLGVVRGQRAWRLGFHGPSIPHGERSAAGARSWTPSRATFALCPGGTPGGLLAPGALTPKSPLPQLGEGTFGTNGLEHASPSPGFGRGGPRG